MCPAYDGKSMTVTIGFHVCPEPGQLPDTDEQVIQKGFLDGLVVDGIHRGCGGHVCVCGCVMCYALRLGGSRCVASSFAFVFLSPFAFVFLSPPPRQTHTNTNPTTTVTLSIKTPTHPQERLYRLAGGDVARYEEHQSYISITFMTLNTNGIHSFFRSLLA